MMQTYSLPTLVRGAVLDIDRTLYDHDEYADEQIETQFRRAAAHWGVSVDETRERVRLWREEYAAGNHGKKQSLGNTLAGLGIPIETSVRWRTEEIHPADYLVRDERLRQTLANLSDSVALIALTNNSVAVGKATLDVLGVGDIVTQVVGLDSTWASKPDEKPFREAVRLLGTPPHQTICVGDRYDVDIEPALAVGLGGVLVSGVSDVYELPTVLEGRIGRR